MSVSSTTHLAKKYAEAASSQLEAQAMPSFDTLSYAKVLQQGGVPTKQAEAMATALLQYLKNEVATKNDTILLQSDLQSDIASFKSEIALIRVELKYIRWGVSILFFLCLANLGFSFSIFLHLLAQS